ncbi:hypothetical protein C8Q76DRAFT_757629 [Earliella scabrosa]|nr:hypothetical protein C8Q76DRAFT_757629 [Earliella scabrosa]
MGWHPCVHNRRSPSESSLCFTSWCSYLTHHALPQECVGALPSSHSRYSMQLHPAEGRQRFTSAI